MELPTPEEAKFRYHAFVKATSNYGLATCICVVCARELDGSAGEEVTITDIPNVDKLLAPHESHQAHQLVGGMLLLGELLEEEGSGLLGWVCHECKQRLGKGHTPKLALANNMWIGPI